MELNLNNFKTRNSRGQFLSGHIPSNKGLTWDDLKIGKRKRKKMLKCLELGRHQKRDNIWKCRSKKIIMFKDSVVVGVFRNSIEAGMKLGICSRNIRSVCQGKRKHAGNFVWKYEINLK